MIFFPNQGILSPNINNQLVNIIIFIFTAFFELCFVSLGEQLGGDSDIVLL